jgi:anti-sigma factor RsiW
MKEDMLEIMIGKYLDGQITHSEQQVLEAELDNNFRAKEFLQQMQDLHQCSREVIASEVLDHGKNAEEIFEQAWQQHRKYPLIRIIRIGGGLRLAAGIAAGLVIGLALHFTVLTRPTTPNIQREPTVAAISPDNASDKNRQSLPSPQNTIRNVDWYTFTDENGDQWLIEGLRENTVRTASFEESI